MRCPRCHFDGELLNGMCAQCGYRRVSTQGNVPNTNTSPARSLSMPLGSQTGPLRAISQPLRAPTGPLGFPAGGLQTRTGPLRLPSPSAPLQLPPGPADAFSAHLPALSTTQRGHFFHQGRYRVVEQLLLPDNQQEQGTAWLAIDTIAGSTQVVIREVFAPGVDQETKAQLVRLIAMRLSDAGQHAGFAKVRDIFVEHSNYYIVLQYIEGESLASLLRRQGGALPEHTVAEYGRQLCEMLTALGRQQPPLVHGAISPETVIVSPDRSRVYLIHLPFFPPKEPVNVAAIASYKAPEQVHNAANAASDLYSVAATLYHAVTGASPRERTAFLYPPASRINVVVSLRMEAILSQALHLSSAQRYARAAEMQKDLGAVLATKQPELERKPVAPVSTFKSDLLQARERSLVQLSIFSMICLVILGGVLVYSYVLPSLKQGNGVSPLGPSVTATARALSRALDAEWQAEAPLYQTKQLGLSDGRYVFDTYPGRPSQLSLNYKKQAAQAVLHNALSVALHDYQGAIAADPTDAEAQIYAQDVQIALQNVPYVTIVLGLPLDASPEHLAISRPALQAAYEFQNRVNTQAGNGLPNRVKLRILIGNSGTADSDVVTLAQFIANRVQLGNVEHIIAVVGWPTSAESSNAIPVLAAAKIPLITQTASSTSLNGASPYFFRVNPNDSVQGAVAGQYAYTVLRARKVLVLRDPNDISSQSLADAFTASFEHLGGVVVDNATDNFLVHTTTVDEYEQGAIRDALRSRVDLIYLSGYDDDAVRLAHAVGQYANIFPFFTNMKILGGSNIDTGLILGEGIGPDAALASANPQDMLHLVFTSFANQAERTQSQPVFFTNWQKLYGAAPANAQQPEQPTNPAIMTDDAFGVIGYSMRWVNGPVTGESLRVALDSIGKEATAPYQGLSGPISFDNDGNPHDKAALIMEVVPDSTSTSGADTLQLVPQSS